MPKAAHSTTSGIAFTIRSTLGAIDILTARNHHVLRAVDDEDIASGVDQSDVAGLEPAVGGKDAAVFLGALPIALHDHRAAHDDFADFARGKGGAVGALDPQFDVREDAPGRGPVADEILTHAHRNAARCLGHARNLCP